MKKRDIQIILAGAAGAFAGSFIGIAAMGDAISGTIPLGLLTAYLMYLWTKDEKTERPEEINEEAAAQSLSWQEVGQAASDMAPVIGKATKDLFPSLLRFFAAIWNLLMKILITIGLMPFFRKMPWLHAVLVFILLAIAFPLGVMLLITGFVAMHKNVKSENNFMISQEAGSAPISPEEEDLG